MSKHYGKNTQVINCERTDKICNRQPKDWLDLEIKKRILNQQVSFSTLLHILKFDNIPNRCYFTDVNGGSLPTGSCSPDYIDHLFYREI